MKKLLIICSFLSGCGPSAEKIEYDKSLKEMQIHCQNAGGDALRPTGAESWIKIFTIGSSPHLFTCYRFEKSILGNVHRKALHIYFLRRDVGNKIKVEIR